MLGNGYLFFSRLYYTREVMWIQKFWGMLICHFGFEVVAVIMVKSDGISLSLSVCKGVKVWKVVLNCTIRQSKTLSDGSGSWLFIFILNYPWLNILAKSCMQKFYTKKLFCLITSHRCQCVYNRKHFNNTTDIVGKLYYIVYYK